MKIKSGDIVWQEKTMINDKNYNDNKDCRVSVVIFSTQIDDEEIVCTCPLTNSVGTAQRKPDCYYSQSYLVLDGKKFSCVKLDSVRLYPTSIVHTLGISVNDIQYDRITEKLLEYLQNTNQDDLYSIIQQNIASSVHSKNTSSMEKRRRRSRHRELVRQAKRANQKEKIL